MRKYILSVILCLATLFAPTLATDITIQSSAIPNFYGKNVGSTSSGTATVTNGSTTVSSSARFPSKLVGVGGYKIVLNGVQYEVASTESTSQLTLADGYDAGVSGSVTFAIYPVVFLNVTVNKPFQPNGSQYVIQSAAQGPGIFYKRVGCSVINNQLIIPDMVLPATTDVAGSDNYARYTATFYSSDGAKVANYSGFESFLVPHTNSTTTWTAIRTYNIPAISERYDNSSLTRDQILAMFNNQAGGNISVSNPSKVIVSDSSGFLSTSTVDASTLSTIPSKYDKTGGTITGNTAVTGDLSIAGTGTAVTPVTTTNTTQLATTAFTRANRGKRPVTTIAALPSSGNEDGDQYAVTDGNRGTRTWRTAVNAWVDETPYFDVTRFGAVADAGVTDSTSAINAAIAAAGDRATVYFPCPTTPTDYYKITGTITLTNKTKLILLGGACKPQIRASAANFDLFNITTAGTDIVFDNLNLRGVAATGTESKAAIKVLTGTTGSGLVVKDCVIENTNNGIINSSDIFDNNNWSGNVFNDMTGGTSGNGYATYTLSQGTRITNNSFNRTARHDVYFSGSDASHSARNNIFANNTSVSCGEQSVAIYATPAQLAVSGNIVNGNTIRAAGAAAGSEVIGLDANAVNNIISNNTIIDSVGVSIYLNGGLVANSYPKKNLISNNTIINQASVQGAIRLQNASLNRIIGNTINGSAYGIFITTTGTPSETITNNQVTGNTTTGTSTASFYIDVSVANTKFNSNYYDQAYVNNSTTTSFQGEGYATESSAVFTVNSTALSAPDTSSGTAGLRFGTANLGLRRNSSDLQVILNGSSVLDIGTYYLRFGGETYLIRDTTDTLALRNGTNAQTWRQYRTYTDGSNYQRLAFNTASSSFTITPESAGTGAANVSLNLSALGTGVVAVGDSATATASAGAATSNTQRGIITSESLTTAAGAAYTLTLTNSKITTASQIFASFTNGSNTQGTLSLGEVTPGSGSATVVIRNIHASQALNGTIKINFLVF